jgi:hypothetical protein
MKNRARLDFNSIKTADLQNICGIFQRCDVTIPTSPEGITMPIITATNSPWQKCENTSAVDGGGKNERK